MRSQRPCSHLDKLGETTARVSRRRQQYLGVPFPCPGILIVYVRVLLGGYVVLELDLLPQGSLFVSQLRGDRLALCREQEICSNSRSEAAGTQVNAEANAETTTQKEGVNYLREA
jgi:hypothetical protein